MCVGYIYEIYDLRTGLSVYVGSTTKHPMLRWAQHVVQAFRKKKQMVHKYMHAQGVENFSYRVREETFYKTKLDLRKREQLWIDQLGPKCNVHRAFLGGKAGWSAYCSRWQRERVVCECGQEISRGYLPKHRKSAKHAQRLKGLKDVLVVKSSK